MKTTISLLAAALLLAIPAKAGNWWQKVSNINVSKEARLDGRGGVLFLYDQKKSFRSEDGGQTWQDLRPQFQQGVFVLETIGQRTFAFAKSSKPGVVDIYCTEDQGRTWELKSSFRLKKGAKLQDVSTLGNGLYAISDKSTIYASWDLGSKWQEFSVAPQVGDLVDFAASPNVWIAVGTEGTVWSANNGTTWFDSYAPMEVGSGITQVESYNGNIYAGGHLGAAKFDEDSRSWNAVNSGLPTFASLVASPVSLKTTDGVLFGVFKTFDGVSKMMRLSRATGTWVPMVSAGIPPHNETEKHNLAIVGNDLYLYYHGSDIGFVGLYKGTNDAPTSVEEEFAAQSTFSVGPNPATSHVNIRSTNGSEIHTITIVDVQGNTIESLTLNSQEAFVPTSGYAAGMYQIRVSDGKSTTTRPIVIKR